MGRALLVMNDDFDRQKAKHWVDKAPVGTRIEFKASKRSLPQNDRLWAMLTDVAAHMKGQGRDYSTEEWKLLFMHAWGREVRFLPGLDMKTVVPVGQSSSDLSKEEMTDLIEFIFAWGAENGVQFNEPREGSESSSALPPAGDTGSEATAPSDLAAELSPSQERGAVDAGSIEAPDGQDALPASTLSDEDREWLKLAARMLWAATGPGEQELLKVQFEGVRDTYTPATISKAARERGMSIFTKCKLVCFGERAAADVLPEIAMAACCETREIV